MSNPNGMIDLDFFQTAIRNHIFSVASKCFETRGSVEIDTPAVEMFRTVQNLYGGDFNKQVFMLENKDEEEEDNNEINKTTKSTIDTRMLLRYDLTLPLCRYVNSLNIKQFKRHQIGKVYRKDTAQISKGRFREFYQMDFDIVGNSEENIYDFEMIDTLCDTLDKLVGIANVTIKINHRSIVNSLLDFAKVPHENRSQVCSILDRLDKVSFKDITTELLTVINDESVKLLSVVYEDISYDKILSLLQIETNVINCMNQLFRFKSNLVFDPFLIRGMDYYTGIIFEVGYINKEIMPYTISAGGRYDNMIGAFGKESVPAIGMSLGVERIARILELTTMKDYKPLQYDIYVATVSKTIDCNITFEQMKLCSELRSNGYRVLTTHIKEQKFKRHLDNVFENNIKYMVILGDNELQKNMISIKNIESKEQITIDRNSMLDYFKSNR